MVTNTIPTRLKSISHNFPEFKDAKNIVSHRDAEIANLKLADMKIADQI